MKTTHYMIWLTLLIAGLTGCDSEKSNLGTDIQSSHGEASGAEPAKGPHGGRLLIDGDFALELSIFETGVPPEFRVWVTHMVMPVSPNEVDLHVTLTRLGDRKDEIGFAAQDDFLRGDTVIYEPHSFVVSIDARYQGKSHQWQYDNFEGRTRIGADVAQAFGLKTELAGPATINDTVTVYGRIEPNREQLRTVSARFEGVIQSVRVSLGDTVRQGQILATVESNESLKPYNLTAPISGVVTERTANAGEQTRSRPLFTIIDTTSVWGELAVFPSSRDRVRVGARVAVRAPDGNVTHAGTIDRLHTIAEANQSVLARVVLDNADGTLVPGTFVTGDIQVAEHAVPLAVKRTGLQAFRDFTVVYAQIGDQFEVRMLELGRQDSEWIEVLGGIDPGARYVTTNSYLIKADIEKSGASHDH
jgi:cobalt-zinc-cadmium efflux system membrane fusion protein